MAPESAPPPNPGDPPALAARAVRLAEIQARADDPLVILGVGEDEGAQQLADALEAEQRAVAWLLGEVRCLMGERDRARDVAVALEQENAEMRDRLASDCSHLSLSGDEGPAPTWPVTRWVCDWCFTVVDVPADELPAGVS